MSSEVIAALLGALAAGLLQTIVSIIDRRRESESTLVAISSEVDSLCRLIRHQRYLDFVSNEVGKIRNENWEGHGIIIDIRCNYFSVFEALSPSLGKLNPQFACKIVNFYSYCKSAIDSTRADGVMMRGVDGEFVIGNLISLEVLLTSILSLGDEIVQFPKTKILLASSET